MSQQATQGLGLEAIAAKVLKDPGLRAATPTADIEADAAAARLMTRSSRPRCAPPAPTPTASSPPTSCAR